MVQSRTGFDEINQHRKLGCVTVTFDVVVCDVQAGEVSRYVRRLDGVKDGSQTFLVNSILIYFQHLKRVVSTQVGGEG